MLYKTTVIIIIIIIIIIVKVVYGLSDKYSVCFCKMEVVDPPAFSRLSVEAPCFIPANFEQSICSTADEAPSYFNDFVWQETELKDASPYLRLAIHCCAIKSL